MRIHLFERNYNGSDPLRESFQNELADKSIKIIHTTDSVKNIFKLNDIILCHDSDSDFLDFKSLSETPFVIILFGGYDTDIKDPVGNLISYINYKHLGEKIDDLILYCKSRGSLDVYKIQEILFDTDSQLDKFLSPFSKLSPFAKAEDPIPSEESDLTVGEAHERLMQFINDKK